MVGQMSRQHQELYGLGASGCHVFVTTNIFKIIIEFYIVHGVHQSKLVTISGSTLQRLKTELSKGRLIVFVGYTTFHSTGSQ